MTLDRITDTDIKHAAWMDDLDDACAALQAIAGITDGGVAALCFCDLHFDWGEASAIERERRLRHWLWVERQLARSD